MKKTKKISLLVFTHTLVAILCLGGMYYVYGTVDLGNDALNDMALINRYSTYSAIQKHNGTPESYKESLLLFSEALDETKKTQSPMFSENAYQTDKMLIKLKLHKLEKKANNTDMAQTLLDEAIEHCNAAKMRDCSAGKILYISDKTEKHEIFNK